MQKFSEIPYQRPDMAALEKRLESKITALTAAKSYEEAREAYLELENADLMENTMSSLAYIRSSINTADLFYEGEVKYINEAESRLMPVYRKANEALLSSPFRAEFEREFGGYLFHDLEEQTKLLNPAIIEDRIEQSNLVQQYQKTTAMCHTIFRGEECNFYGLLKHMQSVDRAERKEAFEAWAKMYEEIAPQLDAQYASLVKLRSGMAKKLGMDNYIQMAYLSKRRYNYGPEDVARFRKQVKEIIVPACAEIYERQRQRLGIDKLYYYDEALIFPEGNAIPEGDKDALVAAAQKMYRELSPETGEFFDFMVQYELFDLESRPGKRMGGYCSSLPAFKAPFIFSNFNGTSADVEVLTHEAGHAFEGYTASRTLPISAYYHSTSEINEIHSMAMEHFTYPWMGLFFKDADKYRYAHLFGALSVIPYMVCVDEFQHRVFENPEAGSKEWRKIWHELEQTYMPWRSYDGNAFLEEGGFWMQKQHIFMYPFYYIDYALAQTGAFEFYSRDQEDHEKAWADYCHLCRLGGSKEYFELLEEAHLHNPFQPGSLHAAVDRVIAQLKEAKY